MLPISTLLSQETSRMSVKNLEFCAKLFGVEDKSVWFDEKQANSNQRPTVGGQKLSTLQVEW